LNAAVILAAGSSSRMGFPKQLAEVRDKPLLQAIIDKVNINFDNSSVVLGSENEIISEKIDFKNSNILLMKIGQRVSHLQLGQLYFFIKIKKRLII